MSSRSKPLRDLIGPDIIWVTVQVILLALLAASAPAERLTRGLPPASPPRLGAAALLMATAAGVAARAKRDLAEGFTMSPTPRDGGHLVDSGIYAHMRHPMYLSLLLLGGGWALAWASRAAATLWLVLAAFVHMKARHEEQLLLRRYPEYAAYRQRVRGRIIPRP